MPRLLHMADVHLGARHDDLGPVAADQRQRQFEAFQRAIELALSEKVDAVLICGDLFDSNSQPRRSVERAAAELARLVGRHIPVVVIPGTHDCYDAASIYRIFDLASLAGAPADGNLLSVLTDARRSVEFPELSLTVRSRVYPAKRAAASPLAEMSLPKREPGDGWQVGMIHGSIAVPGHFDKDEVVITEQEIAASNLDYLALGHWHSFRQGRAGHTVWAYSGAPEPVALDQDGAGQVALVTLDSAGGRRSVKVEPQSVGRSKFEKLEVDTAKLESQANLVQQIAKHADADLVLDVRLVGIRDQRLELLPEEMERELAASFLRLRIRDQSLAPLSDEIEAPPDTIAGAFARDLRARIDDLESRGEAGPAAELREALHYGLLLLDDAQRVSLP